MPVGRLRPVLARPRRLVALAGFAAVLAVMALAGPSTGPASGTAPAAVPGAAADLLGRIPLLHGLSLGLGCANPANRVSHSLLPAAHGAGITCFGESVSTTGSGPALMKGPVGLGPAQVRSVYKLAGLASGGRTVAIVDAYDDPKAESDLAVYRSTYGLPACTTANGCFRKVNQAGAASPLPKRDYGWAEEISLDLDAVSAACPDCHLLLVEANTPDDGPLMTAVDTAVRLGAVAVSNSYGGPEATTQLASDTHLNHPGVAITASSGDSGYGVSWPASSPYVTGVGGTTLAAAGNARGWTETAWSGAGSGCSAYEAKPAWQHDVGCARRTVADVAADANPSSGLGVYDTLSSCGSSSLCDVLISLGAAQGLDGWAQFGGTSLSSPLIASVYALAGNTAATFYGSYPYSQPGSLFDITSGSNGSCGGSYLCTAAPGYDGPTGLGSPNGTGAF